MRRYLLPVLTLCCTLGPLLPIRADEQAQTMRGLAAKYGGSVVTVAITLKTNYSETTSETEVPGVVVDKSGLIAFLNVIDSPSGIPMDGITTTVVAAKVLLPGGGEAPARVVLRDKNRSLAFLRPVRPFSPALPALDFKSARVNAQNADPVYFIGRLGRLGARGVTTGQDRIVGILEKPRKLYMLPTMALLHLGEPVFTEDGGLLGMVTVRAGSGATRSLVRSDSMLPTIVPVEDVWEIAVQAPQLNQVKDAPAAKPAPRSGKPSAPPRRSSPAKPRSSQSESQLPP